MVVAAVVAAAASFPSLLSMQTKVEALRKEGGDRVVQRRLVSLASMVLTRSLAMVPTEQDPTTKTMKRKKRKTTKEQMMGPKTRRLNRMEVVALTAMAKVPSSTASWVRPIDSLLSVLEQHLQMRRTIAVVVAVVVVAAFVVVRTNVMRLLVASKTTMRMRMRTTKVEAAKEGSAAEVVGSQCWMKVQSKRRRTTKGSR